PDDAHPPFPPERVFGDDERDAPGEEEDDPGDEERAGPVVAAVLRRDARKPPDVTRADGDAEHAQEEPDTGGETLFGRCRHGMGEILNPGVGTLWHFRNRHPR